MKKGSNKNFTQGVFIGIVCTLVVVTIISVATGSLFTGADHIDRKTDKKLEALDSLIDKTYLYKNDIDDDVLKEGIIKGYIEALGDPYSEYYDEKEFKELTEATSGKFYGIGAAFSEKDTSGSLEVVRVYENMPAAKAGIKAGDILIKVDGKSIEGKSSDAVMNTVKGDKGTKVKLTFMRNGKEYETTCIRDEVKVPTIEYEMKQDKIGYISISEFTGETNTQFKEAFNSLKSKGMRAMVIDLRFNLGGRVDSTCDILDEILPKGVLAYTKDQKGEKSIVATSSDKTKWEKPIAVLVNEYSASASELFAGALQDYKAATIVGTTTFGKGVMQQMTGFKDGTGVKLTIAKYLTPKGQDINKKGLTPDIKVKDSRTNAEDKNDAQLEKALEILR